MHLLIKLLVLFWLYLAVGYGVVVIGQVLAHEVEKMEDYYDWYITFKLDFDDEFWLNFFFSIIFWPFELVACSIMLVEVGLRKLLKGVKK